MDIELVNELLAVIRIRGSVKVKKKINDTLDMLRLKRVNHCVVIPETLEYVGMLKKAKDRITWGKTNKKILAELLEKRTDLIGKENFDVELLKKITDFNSFEEFSDALIKGKVKLKDYKKIKPVFRLNPPRKGFKSIRLPYPKGDLGHRGEKINELLKRMI